MTGAVPTSQLSAGFQGPVAIPGANPLRKDVFVEVDWMRDSTHSHEFRQAAARPEAAPVDQFVAGRMVADQARIRVETDRISFVGTGKTERPEPRILVMGAALLKGLQIPADRTFRVVADQRQNAAGIGFGLQLHDAAGLWLLAERIQDRAVFQAKDRLGFQVTQRPSGARTFVYQDQCKTVYNVPVLVSFGDQRLELQANEIRSITAGGVRYAVTLQASRFVVTKSCPTVFEGARSEVEYSIVREPPPSSKAR